MSERARVQKRDKAVVVAPGTIRITTSDVLPYEKTENSWKKSSRSFPEAMLAIELFKANDKFDILIDQKTPKFLKGQLSPEGKPQGARINILPNGKELDKAFSLFSQNLTFHHEKSNTHWDVIYKNPGGTYSYLYTREKKSMFIDKKYRAVMEFAKCYPRLRRRVNKALKDENDHLAVPMFTLLKTYMRIGNEMYYKATHHKGLTTLKKSDISIDGNRVSFNYVAKDGVPTNVTAQFPRPYITRLQGMLEPIKESSFVFVNRQTGNPLSDIAFKDAFRRYCGKEFYPHIVRSHYATVRTQDFLAKHKSITKEEMRSLFFDLAEKLGHKRFAKKDRVWKESYNVTVNHYIKPQLVKQIKAAVVK
jgi:hypothetical protein